MQLTELRQKSEQELKRLLADKRERLRQIRFDIHLKQTKNVREIRKLKKLVAQILTLINLKK